MFITVVATSETRSMFRNAPRCADGEHRAAGSVGIMAWALWLAAPVVATTLAALWGWWRARPARRPATPEAMQLHRDYLDALVIPARGTARSGDPD